MLLRNKGILLDIFFFFFLNLTQSNSEHHPLSTPHGPFHLIEIDEHDQDGIKEIRRRFKAILG